MPVDIPMGIVMALSVYLAAWLFKKSNFGFGEEGWKWIITGATMFLVSESMWKVGWNLMGLDTGSLLNWINLGISLFGLLMIFFGAIKVMMSMFSESSHKMVPNRP